MSSVMMEVDNKRMCKPGVLFPITRDRVKPVALGPAGSISVAGVIIIATAPLRLRSPQRHSLCKPMTGAVLRIAWFAFKFVPLLVVYACCNLQEAADVVGIWAYAYWS